MEFKWQALYDRKLIFEPHMTPEGKIKIPNPYYPRVSIVTPENLDVVQVTNFAEK